MVVTGHQGAEHWTGYEWGNQPGQQNHYLVRNPWCSANNIKSLFSNFRHEFLLNWEINCLKSLNFNGEHVEQRCLTEFKIQHYPYLAPTCAKLSRTQNPMTKTKWRH